MLTLHRNGQINRHVGMQRYADRMLTGSLDRASRHTNLRLLDLEALLASRKRARRKQAKMQIEARIDFDDSVSSHSTLLQVVAQNTPGLLRALSLTLADHLCNIEVALIDTEGETAIDVFYLTQGEGKLGVALQDALGQALLSAIEANAR